MINRDRELLRQMSYFFQWVYWRSSDPQADAIRGRRTDATPVDMLKALGAMRKKLKLALGEDVISAQAMDGSWHCSIRCLKTCLCSAAVCMGVRPASECQNRC